MTRPVNPRLRKPKERVYRKGLCCWCGRPVQKPRRDWCSQRCVDEYRSFEPAALRADCYARDRGFCRLCHRDLGGLEHFMRRMISRAKRAEWHPERVPPDLAERARRWGRLIRRLRIDPYRLWEADHKIPVVEGGLNCLANLRTLCLPCHKSETRKLAARRAKARRAQRDLPGTEAA